MSLVQDTARAAVDSFNQAAQQPLPAAAPTENMSLIDMMIKGDGSWFQSYCCSLLDWLSFLSVI
jgi:hypothetical protein